MMRRTDDPYEEEYYDERSADERYAADDPYEEEYYDERSPDEKSPDELEDDIERTRAEMNETLHALQNRLSPGQLIDQTLSYFRGAGDTSTEFATGLGRSIKNNPVPATLLGISLAWLMMGGTEQQHRQTYGKPYRRSPGTSTSGALGKAKESLYGGKEQVQQTAHTVREKAGHIAHEARGKMEGASEAVHHQAGRLGDMAYAQAEHAKEGFTYMLQEHPLVLGSIGIAVGAILGAGLPPTRREDELMGRKRDELLEQAEAMGKEQLHKAEHVARAAQEAAQGEAQRQGLTPEAGKEGFHAAEQKVGHVVGAAQEAAKQEAKRQDLGRPKP